MMEVIRSSDTFVLTRITRRNMLEDGILQFIIKIILSSTDARYAYRERDIILNATCDMRKVTTSFRTLSTVRRSNSSAKLVYALQPVVHRSAWNAEPWKPAS
jgi:hypothetical protein